MNKQHSSHYFLLITLLVSLTLVLAGRYFVSAPSHKYSDILFLFTTVSIASIISVFRKDLNHFTVINDEILIRREYLRETLNSVGEAFIINDLNGVVDDLNISAEKLTGWRKKDVLGKPLESIFRVYDADSGKRVDNIIKQILNNSNSNHSERNYVLKNSQGEKIFITCNGSPIKDAAGVILGTVLVFRNISDKVKLEFENKEIANRLLLATRSAELGIWTWDLKNDILSWDKKIVELYQIEEDIKSANINQWLEFVHVDDRERIKIELNQSIEGLKSYNTEFRIILKDNSIHFLRATGAVERDEFGKPIKMIGVNWDVTKEKLTEENLRRSESFNRGVLNSLSSEIVVIDHNGTILKVSDVWNKFALENGARDINLVGVGVNYLNVCRKAVHSGDKLAAVVLTGIENVITGEKDEFFIEYPCHSKKEKRWFSMKVNRFEGNSSLFVIEHQNITSRKLAEDERKRTTEDLLQRNKNMEQFSFIVSHNLRAPVASILGFGELIKNDETMQKNGVDIMKGMARAAVKLDEIIKDLNIILQTKNQTLGNPQLISFSEIVDDVSKHFQHLAEENTLIIKADFSATNFILSEKEYLRNILHNLIKNSVQFRDTSNQLLVEISSAKTENGIQLKIKDNGLGMDLKKNGEKLFGLYSRLNAHIEGKGMGLFMVKTQVEKLGGNISVKSELKKGAEFIIEFKNQFHEFDSD